MTCETYTTTFINFEIKKFKSFEIVYITPLKNDCDLEEFKESCTILENYIKISGNNNTIFYLVYDMKNMNKFLPNKTINYLKVFKNNKEILRKCLLKTYVCNCGNLAKKICKLILTFYKPVRPYVFVEDMESVQNSLFM